MLTPTEAAIAGLLHDIGKLAERAHPGEAALRHAYGERLEALTAALLPRTAAAAACRHAVWSDWFFARCEKDALPWPPELDPALIRESAVHHHAPRPGRPAEALLATANRLASGLAPAALARAPEEERPRPEEALESLPARIDIGRGSPRERAVYAADPLSAEAILPRPAASDGTGKWEGLWERWQEGFAALARAAPSAGRFEQALLSLSERLLWAVPSASPGQRDVSLHDHARTVAAIAAALAAWHGEAGPADEAAIADTQIPKFRLVVLDLSGIQETLFRLAAHQGAARLLRARSFLMAETLSAALLGLRGTLGLPASSVLLNAGGKAECLAPALPGLEAKLEAFRKRLDAWIIEAWQGDLALVLAASPPFPAAAFLEGDKLHEVRATLAQALESAKHQPFAGWSGGEGLCGTGVIPAPFGADGSCASCGGRPARERSALDGQNRCPVCAAAFRLGQRLPKMEGFALIAEDPQAPASESRAADSLACLPPPWRMALSQIPGREAAASFVFAEEGHPAAVWRPPAHVPLLDEAALECFRALGGGEAEEGLAAGDVMPFEYIAAQALEEDGRGGLTGRALLGILKADVDRLGQIFARGLGARRTPARLAALSRLLDAYFTLRLPWLLRKDFAHTYTVYAGGDDLLLVAPWTSALPLALSLREDFARFSSDNPNLTLSAGLAFVHPRHPLALAVEEAEEALARAKDAGRDRLGLFGRTLGWGEAEATEALARALDAKVRAGDLPTTFLHRLRAFAVARQRAEAGEVAEAGWNAKWRYHLKRFLERRRGERREDLEALLGRCLPPPGQKTEADAEIAITLALWRNR